jgi:hypothetical protein
LMRSIERQEEVYPSIILEALSLSLSLHPGDDSPPSPSRHGEPAAENQGETIK